jgi:hypothetical protein
MASAYLTALITRRDNIAAELAAIETSKPDYSLSGESVSHSTNRLNLLAELEKINLLITRSSVWKLQTRGRV